MQGVGLSTFSLDLHVHTTLSPCASGEMTPDNILQMAKLEGIKLLGITDHNTTANCGPCYQLGQSLGITVLPGMEFETVEEVHVLTLFEDISSCLQWEGLVQEGLNQPAFNLPQVCAAVHRLNGLVIPAHVERSKGVVHELGILPPEIDFDAIEVDSVQTKLPTMLPLITNSDAHSLVDLVNKGGNRMKLLGRAPTFKELQMAFHSLAGRKVV